MLIVRVHSLGGSVGGTMSAQRKSGLHALTWALSHAKELESVEGRLPVRYGKRYSHKNKGCGRGSVGGTRINYSMEAFQCFM